MSEEAEKKKPAKFTNELWQMILPSLTPKQIEDYQAQGLVPGRPGPSEGTEKNERLEWFTEVVGLRGDSETEKSLSITKLMDKGFPKSVAASAYWSGIADGSMLAWSCGWVSSLETERVNDPKTKKDTEYFKLTLKLRAPTQQDIDDRRESWEKKEAKKKRAAFKKPFPMPGDVSTSEEEDIPEEK